MDRNILTIGEQFDASDFDQTNKNAYIAIAKLAYAILGTGTLLNGFTCTQNVIPNLNILLGPGEIYQMAAIDTTPYGDLPVDSHIIFKQGINLDPSPSNAFTFTAPTTPGNSVNYLNEFALQESDIDDENREFYNAAPQVVPTIRADSVFVKALPGTPAPTGTQTTPAPEVGFVGGFVVTIANGQTTITNSNISVYSGAPFITETLTQKISQAFADARYALKAAGLPVATVLDFAGGVVPTGFLGCDGSAVSRSTYSVLFAAIGTTWGVGDGSTTFNLPDSRGRTSIGAGTGGGLTARTLGQTGGEETHILTIPEMPAHTHNFTGVVAGTTILQGGTTYDLASEATSSVGGGGAHNNMQPFAVFNKIIKY